MFFHESVMFQAPPNSVARSSSSKRNPIPIRKTLGYRLGPSQHLHMSTYDYRDMHSYLEHD